MSFTIAALILSTAFVDSDESVRCTLVRNQDSFTRPANASVLVLQATRDSALVGHYVTDGGTPRRVDPNSEKNGRAVYGQIFNLRAAEGLDAVRISAAKRVVVSWWTLTPSCGQHFPRPVVRVRDGEAFVLSQVRDKNEWAGGLPTFDVAYQDWVYIPSEYRADVPSHNAMTVDEYRTLFSMMLPSQRFTGENLYLRQQLFNWADSNPRLAAKYPALETLCMMRMIWGGNDRECFNRR